MQDWVAMVMKAHTQIWQGMTSIIWVYQVKSFIINVTHENISSHVISLYSIFYRPFVVVWKVQGEATAPSKLGCWFWRRWITLRFGNYDGSLWTREKWLGSIGRFIDGRGFCLFGQLVLQIIKSTRLVGPRAWKKCVRYLIIDKIIFSEKILYFVI